MTEQILSVGVDLGTTTTQIVVSKLFLQNTAAPFTVPRMEIGVREIVYRSPVHFTPLLSADTIDAEAVRTIIAEEYRRAEIRPSQVQTGAVIITGETARKENARQVLQALADFAGDFVVATAGPALESILAARGAGADRWAAEHGRAVLHMDIGGGTSNLALYDDQGKLQDTGCLNVGGRLLKFDSGGFVTYVSPVLQGMDAPAVGEKASPERLRPLLDTLVQALEEAAGLRPASTCLTRLITDKTVKLPQTPLTLSFSGGVADLIDRQEDDWLKYGDLGVLLGRAIQRSRLCADQYILGQETIRATVVGAGSHATELSGSTISYTGVAFPVQNLPAVTLSPEEELQPSELLASSIRQKLSPLEGGPAALALRGLQSPPYAEVLRMAEGIADGLELLRQSGYPLVVTLEHDMAKALGQAMAARLPGDPHLICLDGLHVPEGSYLDIAAPVGGGAALPVVVKTLAFS